MELTVGKLKKILAQVDDDVLLADLGFGNRNFSVFCAVKRLFLLQEDKTSHRFLTINKLGSHFTGEGDQRKLVIIKYFNVDD